MPGKNLPTGRKKAFDSWIASIIEDLNLRSKDSYDVKDLNSQLKPWHWQRLWQIFGDDTNHFGAKEELMAGYEASDFGRNVILEAYGKSDTDLMFEELMDHYLNSPNYD